VTCATWNITSILKEAAIIIAIHLFWLIYLSPLFYSLVCTCLQKIEQQKFGIFVLDTLQAKGTTMYQKIQVHRFWWEKYVLSDFQLFSIHGGDILIWSPESHQMCCWTLNNYELSNLTMKYSMTELLSLM